MRRIVSLWLPHWRTGPKRPAEPSALTATSAGTERLAAVSEAAAAAGLRPGMTLADARALVPALTTRPDDPAVHARRLERLADRMQRFTPWTAPCGDDGLMLDVSGCAHLFGGEAALVSELSGTIAKSGFSHTIGLADTPGSAWAVARFAEGGLVPPGAQRRTLADLPMAALRLPADTVAALARVGLRRTGSLYGQARGPLARRFGQIVLDRLDEALGERHEPISPRHAGERHLVCRHFVEPVADTASIVSALHGLLAKLAGKLARTGLGVRKIALVLKRVDGSTHAVTAGTAAAHRDTDRLAALLQDRLDGLDAGFGIETIELEARVTEPLIPCQVSLDDGRADTVNLAVLVERLANRLGPDRIVSCGPGGSHLPERAVRRTPSLSKPSRPVDWPPALRPPRLFDPPQPVEITALTTDGLPARFVWKGLAFHVVKASGLERIAGEWWRDDMPTRDYCRIEDTRGTRLWLYRERRRNGDPRWLLHGIFG